MTVYTKWSPVTTFQLVVHQIQKESETLPDNIIAATWLRECVASVSRRERYSGGRVTARRCDHAHINHAQSSAVCILLPAHTLCTLMYFAKPRLYTAALPGMLLQRLRRGGAYNNQREQYVYTWRAHCCRGLRREGLDSPCARHDHS